MWRNSGNCNVSSYCYLPLQNGGGGGAAKALQTLNLLTVGAAFIQIFTFYYHILNMLKIKCDINQQDLKRVDLRFVKSE